jgi:hypothetical protein
MNNRVVSQADYSMFLVIVNTHYETIDQFMVLLTIYGREIFMLLVIVLVFITGKKGA